MRKESAPARRRAVVVGGGLSGLVAARELAKAGTDVTVLEASPVWGGCIGSHEVAGLILDSGAESFATRSTAVAELAGELGLASAIVAPRPGGAWVQLPDGPRELPKTGVLGIPANPWDPEVRHTLGLAGSLRAALDRWLPASYGASGDVTSVADLVRARMGKRVLERLVAPVVGGVHSADPALLDVDMVAPGLRAGQREHGSLAAAVAAQRRTVPSGALSPGQQASGAPSPGQQASGAPSPGQQASGREVAKPGSAVGGLRGGMHTLVAALLADLRSLGAALQSGTRATAVTRTGTRWTVIAEAASGKKNVDAELLVVALDGPAAVGLLEGTLPALAALRPEAGPEVRLVTMVVDMPELDNRPRGTGILVAPQTPGITAKALTHATGKWDWLAEEAGPGTHVLRLSYGRHGSAGTDRGAAGKTEATAGARNMSDAALLDVALQDASALLQVPLAREDVLGWDVVRWEGALPFAAVGHRQRVNEVRRICREAGGLAVVGGWLAGNGLAAIVADTPRQLEELLASEPAD